ncbi:hypothetical protein ZWY2020_029382 [Hordeum vulgare]|nr:hypothetical protein ZWY2020_029382 [Hordeum vulgare]
MRGGGGGGPQGAAMRGGGGGGLRNPCLTMHQPWASLLVHGIKRVEGRSWPSPVTGRLWIHAASKVPDPDTVTAMEDFYREIYVVDGVHHIDFPRHYPVSRLLGCVDVVGCVTSEELVCWEDVPQSVRLEGLTDFCWLCENPQKLVVPFEILRFTVVYNLERRVSRSSQGLRCSRSMPVKFPLPDPRNPLSLKPGSLNFDSSKSALVKTESVSAAIAGARASATQYSRKGSSAARISSYASLCSWPAHSSRVLCFSSPVDGDNVAAVRKDRLHWPRTSPAAPLRPAFTPLVRFRPDPPVLDRLRGCAARLHYGSRPPEVRGKKSSTTLSVLGVELLLTWWRD